uniref:Uncharacterized protein n=1 Tax=Sphaerodactylus townsendi TaxID=933632 RepID=A0ACB8E9J3_9SAUR
MCLCFAGHQQRQPEKPQGTPDSTETVSAGPAPPGPRTAVHSRSEFLRANPDRTAQYPGLVVLEQSCVGDGRSLAEGDLSPEERGAKARWPVKAQAASILWWSHRRNGEQTQQKEATRTGYCKPRKVDKKTGEFLRRSERPQSDASSGAFHNSHVNQGAPLQFPQDQRFPHNLPPPFTTPQEHIGLIHR